jgi:AcrR family transcriptional regulator
MTTTKKTEIRDREAKILELALKTLETEGVAAISMEAIAAELQITRGTVYNHFRNKEDILLALAIQAAEQRLSIFEHAVMMRGNPRQRMAAIGIACEYFADQFPALLKIEYQIRHDMVWEKTSVERQELLQQCEAHSMQCVTGVVRDGVASGDLEIADPRMVEGIVFGLWSLVHGGMLLELTSPSLSALGIRDSRIAIRAGCNALLDGFRWQPLFDPAEYEDWVSQVHQRFKAFHPLTTTELLARLKS